MELYRNAPPATIGIPRKLLPRDLEATGAGAYPYRAAAQELGLLVLESCPQKKLECIGEGLQFGRTEEGTWSDKVASQRVTGVSVFALSCRPPPVTWGCVSRDIRGVSVRPTGGSFSALPSYM